MSIDVLRTNSDATREYSIVKGISDRIKRLLSEGILENSHTKNMELSIDWAIELGTGWVMPEENCKIIAEVLYSDINPNLMVPTTTGHPGKLVLCMIAQQQVLFMCGRIHHYEGFAAYEIVRMTRALCMIGVKRFVFTNAAGSLDASLKVGDIMVITDHLSGLPSPLAGAQTEFGPRHISMGSAYDKKLIQLLLDQDGSDSKISLSEVYCGKPDSLKQGIYASVEGPEFETPVQVRLLKQFSLSAVGMSTTQQVLAVAQHNAKEGNTYIPVVGFSLITNIAEDGVTKLDHSIVLANASKSNNGTVLLQKLIEKFTPQSAIAE